MMRALQPPHATRHSDAFIRVSATYTVSNMAASAKKKNKKGKTLTLTDFLAEDSKGSTPQYYPPTKPTSWADETDDFEGEVSTSWHTEEDSYRAPPIDRSLLPTAPRAAREPNIDRSRLPRSPPYTAFLGNLPYDVSEESIKDFFRGLAISAVRLPREPNNPERLKGFGYAEFDDVESLLQALTLNEENLGNRRIRVDIADQSNDKERDSGMMSGRDRGRGMDLGPDKTDSDWRARPSADQDDGPRRDDDYGERSRDRYESDRNRDGPWRDDRYGGRDRYDDRDRRDRFGDRDRYGDRDRRDRYDDRGSRDYERGAPLQRPKLNLKPRTIPKDEEQSGGTSPQTSTTSAGGRSASIFGAAKPVDTAAKEREVEERLKKEQDRLQRQLDDDKGRPSERRPRDRDPSWRSEMSASEHERTGNNSTHPGGPKSHQSDHSENEVFSGQEDEPASSELRTPTSPSRGALPLKTMPAPPPKENAWAKRSTGGSPNAPSTAAYKQSSQSDLGDEEENQLDGADREKGMSQGRGGQGRDGEGPNKDKRREPDRKEIKREREPKPIPEPKKYEETAPPKFSSASKYAALLMDGDQGEDEDGEN
uniref:Eukaryotic translation initiation factor 4B n=1 Tax=Astyanax mexicanus TaxID=7994 RepID=A0A8B9L7I2_ASTMX